MSYDPLEKLAKLEQSADTSDVSCDYVYIYRYSIVSKDWMQNFVLKLVCFSISSCVRKLALLNLTVHQREIQVSPAQQRY